MIPGGELSGKFQVTTNNINNRIYVVIPERVIINSITLNGFDIPIAVSQITFQDIIYNVYRSENAYDAGTYDVFIGTYAGQDRDLLANIVNRLQALENNIEE